jgi:hypothetical protein
MGRLLAEYLAALRTMCVERAQELAACGIPWSAITAVTPVPMRITINRAGNRYRPDDAGELGWVLPVAAVDPGCPELVETTDPLATIATGRFIDLAAAFSPTAPGRWALRRGRATVLGAIPPQYLEPEPVRVHRDVAGWLRAGCDGIVLLTRDPAKVRRIFSQIARIDQTDAEPVGAAVEISKRTAVPRAEPVDRRRQRLEGLLGKMVHADRARSREKLVRTARLIAPAVRDTEIRSEVAELVLVRAAARAGLADSEARRIVAGALGATTCDEIKGEGHAGEWLPLGSAAGQKGSAGARARRSGGAPAL